MKKYFIIAGIVALWIYLMWLPSHVRADNFAGGVSSSNTTTPAYSNGSGTSAYAATAGTASALTSATSGSTACMEVTSPTSTNQLWLCTTNTLSTGVVATYYSTNASGTSVIGSASTGTIQGASNQTFISQVTTSGLNTVAILQPDSSTFSNGSSTRGAGYEVHSAAVYSVIATQVTSTATYSINNINSKGTDTFTNPIWIGLKSFTLSNSLAFAGTDGTTMTFPGTSKTMLANDFSNVGAGANLNTTGTATFGGNPLLITHVLGTQTIASGATNSLNFTIASVLGQTGIDTASGLTTSYYTTQYVGAYQIDSGVSLTSSGTISSVQMALVSGPSNTLCLATSGTATIMPVSLNCSALMSIATNTWLSVRVSINSNGTVTATQPSFLDLKWQP